VTGFRSRIPRNWSILGKNAQTGPGAQEVAPTEVVLRKILAWLACAVWMSPAMAGSATHDHSLSVFYGKFTADPLEDILSLTHHIDFDPAWVTVLTYNRVLARPSPVRQWEGELQFGVHSGLQDHLEVTTALVHRWHSLPWDGLVRLNPVIGAGLSHTSDVPLLEAEGKPGEDAQRLLFYLMFELEVAPYWADRWSIFARIHHRSGVFGTFGGVHGGSDHVGLGFRWFFGSGT
jgi:hypothetical protein